MKYITAVAVIKHYKNLFLPLFLEKVAQKTLAEKFWDAPLGGLAKLL